MDEETFIIAAMMAEEERLRQEKKAAERRQQQKLLESYQPLQYDQRPSRSIGKWFILGAVIIVIYLLSRN